MNKALLVLLCVATLDLPLTLAAQARRADEPAAETASASPRYTPIQVLNQPRIQWPVRETGREALVFIRMVVSPEGRITETTLVEGRGFHNPDFVDAAMSLARSYRFKPPTVDGKPVQQGVVLPVAFGLGSETGSPTRWVVGVSDEFRSEMRKLEELYRKGDYAGADAHAQKMLKDRKVRYGYEYYLLKATMAQTHAAAGHDEQALRFAEEASERTTAGTVKLVLHQPIPPNSDLNYVLPRQTIVALLDLRMRLATRLSLWTKALRAYYELAGLEKLKPDDPRTASADRIMARLESTEALPRRGTIEAGSWYHELFRRRFTLESVRGTVVDLFLACSGERKVLPYAPAEEWTVPPDWENCYVSVSGEEGTSFLLVELAD